MPKSCSTSMVKILSDLLDKKIDSIGTVDVSFQLPVLVRSERHYYGL